MSRTLALQAALGGPGLAGAAWLGLSLFRRRWPRRLVGAVLALGAHAAAWWVFWLAFEGGAPTWRGFVPGVLGATVAVAAEAAILLAAIRLEGLERRAIPAAGTALGVAASAVVAAAYTGSLPVLAVVVVLPTVAVAAAVLGVPGRPDLRGLVALGAADVLAVAGLVVAQIRGESVGLAPSPGAAAFLLLAAAAVKVGAVPGLGTWRMASLAGSGGLVSVALRAQGIALAAIAGLALGAVEGNAAIAGLAAAAVFLGGVVALALLEPRASVAGAVGAGGALLFLALGLGGAVGTRAFLVLMPAFLLAAGAVALVGWPGGVAPRPPRAGWRWLGAASLAAAVLSVLGFPPAGGFPGTWLTLSLAGLRAEASPAWFLALGGTAVGLMLAGLAAVPAIRSVRPSPSRAIPAALVGAALLYIGLQPVRLAVGWWVRIEADLGTPVVLGSTGVPELPVLGGRNLAMLVGQVALLVAAIVALARGFRDEAVPPVAATPVRLRAALERVRGRLPRLPLVAPLAAAWGRGLDFGVLVALELAAAVLIGLLLVDAAASGFL